MGHETYDLGDGGYTRPADESIDEALARLARQDARRGADGAIIPSTTTPPPESSPGAPPTAASLAALQARLTAQMRAPRGGAPASVRPPSGQRTPPPVVTPTVTTKRNGAATLVRWVIILGLTWFFIRFFLR